MGWLVVAENVDMIKINDRWNKSNTNRSKNDPVLWKNRQKKMYTNVICYAKKKGFFFILCFVNFFREFRFFLIFFGFCVSYESNHKKNNLNSCNNILVFNTELSLDHSIETNDISVTYTHNKWSLKYTKIEYYNLLYKL